MTGTLSYAATNEHVNELRAAAGNRRRDRSARKARRERRLPALPGPRRPRLAA